MDIDEDIKRKNELIAKLENEITELEKKIEDTISEISRYETTYKNIEENVKLMKAKYEEEFKQFKQTYDNEIQKINLKKKENPKTIILHRYY